MLMGGLRLVISRPGAVLWTYAFNLGVGVLFSLRLHAQLGDLLNHSMASERLNSAFDLGTLASALLRMQHNAPATGVSNLLGVPVYWLFYLVLVPGSLFCYQTAAPSHLAIMTSLGLQFFWRFVRITCLTMLVSAVVLGPLILLQFFWADHVSQSLMGVMALLLQLPGVAVILLVAAMLRLYFDLVEVYTVHLNDQFRASGKPDRRVRRTLLPALRVMVRELPRALGSFLFLAVLGFAVVLTALRTVAHLIAQDNIVLIYLVAQIGFFAMLFTRFWQRGAETILALDNPIPLEKTMLDTDPEDQQPLPQVPDAQSDPEPAPPSLEEPDPAVFHPDTSAHRKG